MNCRGAAGVVGSEEKAEGKAPPKPHARRVLLWPSGMSLRWSVSAPRAAPRNQVPLKTEGCTRQGENLRLLGVRTSLDRAPDFPNEDRDLSQLHAAQDSPWAGDGSSVMDARLHSWTERQQTGAGYTQNFLRFCRRQRYHGSHFCHQSLCPRELLNDKVLKGLW